MYFVAGTYVPRVAKCASGTRYDRVTALERTFGIYGKKPSAGQRDRISFSRYHALARGVDFNDACRKPRSPLAKPVARVLAFQSILKLEESLLLSRGAPVDREAQHLIGGVAPLRTANDDALNGARQPFALALHPCGNFNPSTGNVLRGGRRRLEDGVRHFVGKMRVAGVADRRHHRVARAHDRAHDRFGIERIAIFVRASAAEQNDRVHIFTRRAIDRLGNVDFGPFTLNARLDKSHRDVRRFLSQRRLKIVRAFAARRDQRDASGKPREVALARSVKEAFHLKPFTQRFHLGGNRPDAERRDLDDAKLILTRTFPNADRSGRHNRNAVAHDRKSLGVTRVDETAQDRAVVL